ncbi:phosphoglucomutase/phosphomannomutase family protein [bacterium]|nr:phosphoglucomutase/phosphomannomutase family protein [bacterium]
MIKFGTDGWRGLIARDFTFENIRYVALATCNYLNKSSDPPFSAVIGYDTRFLSAQFAEEVAKVFAENGVKTYLANSVASTPQTSYNCKYLNASIGIMITASHNPPEYNGYKLKANYGGPASPEIVSQVEKEIPDIIAAKPEIKLQSLEYYINNGSIVITDFKENYLNYLQEKFDFQKIRKSGIKIIFDPMYGAGINTLGYVLPYIKEIHCDYNPSFGDIDHPEPIESMLGELKGKTSTGFDIGLASDGDADRLGTVDELGNFVDAHKIYMIILNYLYKFKNLRGKIVKTVSLTSMVDKFAKKYNIELIETPVGFKYAAELMAKGGVLIGGEESGGLGTILHIPERDGIFNGLLIIEEMIERKMKLSELVSELENEFGKHIFKRIDIYMTEEEKSRTLSVASNSPSMLGSQKVQELNNRDGFKFITESGWLLIRASGTEPLVRFYAESDTEQKVEELLNAGLNFRK